MKIYKKGRSEVFRFLIAGTIVNAADFSIYYALFHFLPFSAAKGISFTCAGLAGYFLNKYWTFKQDQRSYAEIGRYVLINLLALGVNILVNQGLLNLWPGAVWPALIITTVLTGFMIFICFKWWVFKP